MRILLVGDFQGQSDEGMRSISHTLYNLIAVKQEVLKFNTREAVKYQFLNQTIKFKPQIIHYITGPTLRSLIILKIYKFLFSQAKTISSAVRPFFSARQRFWIGVLKPDLFLTQDPRWEKEFKSHGAAVLFLPNGVDSTRFHPATPAEKKGYREKFGLAAESRIILHVGHLRQNRNLELLVALQTCGAGQVVLVSGTAMKQEDQIRQSLKAAGCIVIDTYQKEIEQIYAAADVFVFPVLLPPGGELPHEYNQVGVIDMPLSVLEAMAINLRVITVPFPALQRLFPAKIQGLHWFDGSVESCLKMLDQPENEEIQTRQAVLGCDWRIVVSSLEECYEALIAGTTIQSSGKW